MCSQFHTDADTEPIERAKSSIEDVPIFRTEEEKIEFEQSLNVDLSLVDHMFKVRKLQYNKPFILTFMHPFILLNVELV